MAGGSQCVVRQLCICSGNPTEYKKSLSMDSVGAASYRGQIQDMVHRGAARKLTSEESEQWQGPKFYICHLAVMNLKSNRTPVRIVFNSSQTYKDVSLNNRLAKGPDSYANSGFGILLRWREQPVAVVGDIRKMYHSIFLKPLELQHHSFLWRDLDSTRDPDIYIIQRVNMGDRPAAAIATEALYMTADLGQDQAPKACNFIKSSSYMDDLISSVGDRQATLSLTKDTEMVLQLGGFQVKRWQLTGESTPLNASDQQLKGDSFHIGVLGVSWSPVKDTVTYDVSLNFSHKRKCVRRGPDIQRHEILEAIPQKLTRRIVLQQVMSIYDPMGLIFPFTLLAKIYLWETWSLKLDWDEELPPRLHEKWTQFFQSLFQLEDLAYPRYLRPEDAVGQPWLIILSDGSDTAYGCAAYARWECQDGTFKVWLIIAKSPIAPLNKVSTPRMELNGAGVSKRCCTAICKEMNYQYDRILHLVHSETVLAMLHKTSYRFHVPMKLQLHSEWLTGPSMLSLPFEEWNIKFAGNTQEILPGEKRLTQTHSACVQQPKSLIDYANIGSVSRAVRVMARVINIVKNKSFHAGKTSLVMPALLQQAEETLLREVQNSEDIGKADYRRLNPAQKENGIWFVRASRLTNYNPISVIHANLPIFLPRKHPLAKLAMEDAHKKGHRGRDATLAAFRNKYWTPAGPRWQSLSNKTASSASYEMLISWNKKWVVCPSTIEKHHHLSIKWWWISSAPTASGAKCKRGQVEMHGLTSCPHRGHLCIWHQ